MNHNSKSRDLNRKSVVLSVLPVILHATVLASFFSMGDLAMNSRRCIASRAFDHVDLNLHQHCLMLPTSNLTKYILDLFLNWLIRISHGFWYNFDR